MTQKKQEAPKVEKVEKVETQKQEAPKVEKPKKAKKPVDKGVYDKYTSLKFLRLSGAKMTDEALKQLETLEKEISSCDGAKPIRTQRAAIDNEQVLIVEGMPLPDEYFKIIKGSINPKYYLGK